MSRSAQLREAQLDIERLQGERSHHERQAASRSAELERLRQLHTESEIEKVRLAKTSDALPEARRQNKHLLTIRLPLAARVPPPLVPVYFFSMLWIKASVVYFSFR